MRRAGMVRPQWQNSAMMTDADEEYGRWVETGDAREQPGPRLDVAELGALRRLARGTLWADHLAPDQHAVVMQLCAHKLAESVSVQKAHRTKRGGVFFRITDQGKEQL